MHLTLRKEVLLYGLFNKYTCSIGQLFKEKLKKGEVKREDKMTGFWLEKELTMYLKNLTH